MARSRPARYWLLVIVVVCATLHILLASRGGQGYWPDEHRYDISRQVVTEACNGHWHSAAAELLGSPDHLFFRFIGLLPALLEHVFFRPDAIPPGFAAGFFGLWGVGAVALIWLIAREETRDEPTATWCAFFYAGCVTGFFFSRHYFPYDPAIALLLLGWWLGLRSRIPFHHWLTGTVVGLGYLTYNAYWNLGAVILIFHVLRPRAGSSPFLRAGWAAFGLVSPIVVLVGTARLLGYDLIAQAREFSQTVTQGGFGHGWRYIPAYFATAEGAYGALLLLLAGAGLITGVRKKQGDKVWLWPAMAAALAAELVFFSDVIPRFALSGRSIKPLGLFLALSAGLAAGRFGLHLSRSRALALIVLAAGLAALNFRMPLSLQFPQEFRLEAQGVIAAERARDPDAPLQMYYADFMHLAQFLPAYPPHTVLRQHPHPLQYRPYQFEGFDGPTRAGFQTHDFSMRLVRVTGMAAWQTDTALVGPDLQPYAGALQLEIDLPYPRPIGHTEPLVTAGIPGLADLFLIHYLDGQQIEILVDHWNWGMVRSAPFLVPTDGQPQRVMLCAGSLLPPVSHPAMLHDPDLQALSQQAIVTWNDQIVLRQTLPLYSTPVSGVAVGGNYVGGTTSDIGFTGHILRIRQADPRLLMRRTWGVVAPDPLATQDANPLGPLLVDFEWDAPALQTLPAEAAVFAARQGTCTSMLTVRKQGTDAVFSFWLQGQRLVASSPQAVTPGPHQLEIWSPLLASSPRLQSPELQTVRDWVSENSLLLLDGRPIIQHTQPVRPATAAPTTGAGQPPGYFLAGRSWPLDAAGAAGPFPGRITQVEPVRLAGPVLLRTLWRDKLRGSSFANGPVGPLRLKLRFPLNRTGAREPLLASGSNGAADVLFVVYEPDGRIRIGHDHWGWALLLSEPIALDPAAEHSIDISMGSLYPADDPAWRPSPLTTSSRVGRLYVAVDGQPLLSAERECYLAPLASLVVGRNLPGSSTCGPQFTGELLEISRLESLIIRPPAARSAPPRQ